MKNNLLTFILLLFVSSISYASSVHSITVQNGYLTVQLDKQRGHITEIKKGNKVIQQSSDFSNALWSATFQNSQGEEIKIDASTMREFSFVQQAAHKVELRWKGSTTSSLANLQVIASIEVVEKDSISLWGLRIEGIDQHSIEKVVYPIVGGITNSAQSQMAIPSWMGHLYPNPKSELAHRTTRMARWVYPGMFSMQFLSIYDPQESGFYAASNDAKSHQKEFVVRLNDAQQLVSEQIHFPEYKQDMGVYEMPYQAVIGGFSGDWLTAAMMYRAWGTAQDWAKNSRLSNNKTADWLKNTSLWVWNRGRVEEVLQPAEEAQSKLGLPVSVLWHWWHNSSYDDTFPDYIPPRDGRKVFVEGIERAKQKNINAIVYMNQLQWAKSTPSWSAEGAERFAARNKDGSTTDHVYNIFSGRSLTNMCIATDFWRNKYTSIADTVLNKYGVSGIYMDQACLSRMCFDKSHGHNLGGGNYWMQGSARLTEQIRQRTDASIRNAITLSGEGVSESWLPYLDAFLALQVSMERYAGIGAVPIPLFQAVYHPYGIVYGNYSSLLKPPYDEKWPDTQRPTDALTLLDEKYVMQFKMEQGRSFVWGMQPMLSNYRSFLETERKEEMAYLYQLAKVRNNALAYLQYGEMMPNISLESNKQKLAISKLSIYVGQKEKVTHFEKEYPTFYSTVWKSQDNKLGIAVSNIATATYRLPLHVNLAHYGLTKKKGKVYLINELGRKQIGNYRKGMVDISVNVPTNTSYVIEID